MAFVLMQVGGKYWVAGSGRAEDPADHVDVEIEVQPDDLVAGRTVRDWGPGVHDLPHRVELVVGGEKVEVVGK